MEHAYGEISLIHLRVECVLARNLDQVYAVPTCRCKYLVAGGIGYMLAGADRLQEKL